MTLTLSPAQVKARADIAYAHQVQYDQDATTSFGLSDGRWRSDCSGLVSAVAGITPSGTYCPNTSALRSTFVSAEIARAAVVPYRTIFLVTNSDGFPYGHTGLVVGFDKAADRLQILEHGGGIGPEKRWLPAGATYDSVARYGRARDFRLYNLLNVTGTAPTPPPVSPGKPNQGTKFPWGPNDYIGPEEWGQESHGGFYASERPLVAAALRKIGRPANGGHFHVADLAASKAWQLAAIKAGKLKMSAANATGRIGPLTFAAMGL